MGAFFRYASQAIDNQKEIDIKQFNREVSAWEWSWVNQRKDYPLKTVGSSVSIAIEMHKKYRSIIDKAHQYR